MTVVIGGRAEIQGMRRALPGADLALADSLDSLRRLRQRLARRRGDVTVLLALAARDLTRCHPALRSLVDDLPALAARARCVGVLVDPSVMPQLATFGCDLYIEPGQVGSLFKLLAPSPRHAREIPRRFGRRRRPRSRLQKKAFGRYRPQAMGSAADCGDGEAND